MLQDPFLGIDRMFTGIERVLRPMFGMEKNPQTVMEIHEFINWRASTLRDSVLKINQVAEMSDQIDRMKEITNSTDTLLAEAVVRGKLGRSSAAKDESKEETASVERSDRVGYHGLVAQRAAKSNAEMMNKLIKSGAHREVAKMIGEISSDGEARVTLAA